MTTEDKALATGLSALARRVMDLKGPSYEMDCAIWDAIYPGERAARFEKLTAKGSPYHMRLGLADMDGYVRPLRAFTTSLDAAMTLVPPHTVAVSFDLEFGLDGETCGAILTIASLAGNQEVRAVAKTHFNAITAAALLARGDQSDANT